MSDNCKVDDCQQRELNAEIERLQPYVAAFQREEERADKLGQEVDELRDQLVIAGEHIAEMMDRLASARKSLEEYGQHTVHCDYDRPGDPKCTCGFSDEISALTDEKGTP